MIQATLRAAVSVYFFTCRRRIAAILVCGLAVGCGARGPELAEVNGRVTFRGQPLPDVRVTFAPENPGDSVAPLSSSVTDEQGAFSLKCVDGRNGAVIGAHRVMFEDLRVQPGAQPAGRDAQDDQPLARMPARVVIRIPDQFRSVATSPLTRDVAAGTNSFDLELTP